MILLYWSELFLTGMPFSFEVGVIASLGYKFFFLYFFLGMLELLFFLSFIILFFFLTSLLAYYKVFPFEFVIITHLTTIFFFSFDISEIYGICFIVLPIYYYISNIIHVACRSILWFFMHLFEHQFSSAKII